MRKQFVAFAIAAAASITVPGLLRAETITVTLEPEADTYIRGGSDNTNEGSSTFLQLQSSGNNRSLLRFRQVELDSALGGGTLVSATLKLTITGNGDNWGSSGRTVDVHRMTANWAEGNGRVNGYSPSDRGTGNGATWNCALDTDIANSAKDCTGSTEWIMSGSGTRPWNGTATSSQLVTNGQSGVLSFDVLSDIQAFASGTPNHGWVLKKTAESDSGTASFGSRESASKPVLELVVDTPDGNFPPAIAGNPISRVNEGDSYLFVPAYSDQNPEDDLTFSVQNLPPWADFDTATGEVSGVPGLYDVGMFRNIVITVTDSEGASDTLLPFDIAVTVTLEPAADTYLRSGDANTNEGGSVFLRVRESGDNRTLVKFSQSELAALAGGRTLVWALLEADIQHNGDNWGTTGRTVDVHRMTSDWTEGNGKVAGTNPSNRGTGSGATWNCATDTDIANQAKNCSSEWDMSGSGTRPWETNATSSVLIENLQTGTVSWNVTGDTAAFLSGTSDNYGWVVRKTSESQSGLVEFDSRESGNLPRLVLALEDTGGNQPPVISGTPALSVNQDALYTFTPIASDPDAGSTLTFTITGKPSWASFNAATGQLGGTPTNADVGVYGGIVISVSDQFGASASLPAFSITVVNVNDAPVISGTPATFVLQGSAYSFAPLASDPDQMHGDTLTFSVVNKPSWMSFSPATGLLSGTPGNSDVGVYGGIQISVTDAGGLSASLTPFSVTVINTNDAPVISGTSVISVEQDSAYAFTPSASDPDQIHGDTLIFSVTNKPGWASFSTASGLLSGTPGNGDVGSYAGVVISVSDSTGASASLPPFQVTVVNVNDAPSIAGSPAASVDEGSPYTFTPVASDPDQMHGETLTFSVANKPAWASFSTATGSLAGTPSYDDAGVYAGIVISVTDGSGASAVLPPFQVTVVNVNRSPSISGTPAGSVNEDTAYLFVPASVDPDAGDLLSFSVQNLPSWASFSAATGQLSGTPANGDVGIYGNIIITVTDGAGAQTSLPAFSITVVNTNDAPVISGSPASSVNQNEFYSFTPSASDPDGIHGDILEFSIVNEPSWVSFDALTGTLTGTPLSADIGVYGGIVITVSDLSGASASLPPFSITVGNVNDGPSIFGTPATDVDEDSLYSFTPSAMDPDLGYSDTLTFLVTNLPAWASFDTETGELSGTPLNEHVGLYSGIVISVQDSAGAIASLPAFSITVHNTNDAPVISGTPATGAMPDAYYEFIPVVSDPDSAFGDTLTFTIENLPGWASFDPDLGVLYGVPSIQDEGTYPGIVIIVTDASGAIAQLAEFEIAVGFFNEPPVLTGNPPEWVTVGEFYSFTPVVFDPDGEGPFYFYVEGLPSWASYDWETGHIYGTPLNAFEWSLEVVIYVSDDWSGSSFGPFAIKVRPVNRAPTISGSPARTANIGSPYSFIPAGNDPDLPYGDTLLFSAENLPPWCAFDSQDGRISGTPWQADTGQYDGIRVIVTDAKGASASISSFSIEVPSVCRGDSTYRVVSRTPIEDGSPRGIASGDYNEDGITDLAITDSTNNRIVILEGEQGPSGGASGLFAMGQALETGVQPSQVFAKDINGDMHSDLVSVDQLGGTLSVFFGTGSGSFGPGATTFVGDYLNEAIIEDLTGDGLFDVAVSSYLLDTVHIMKGMTDGIGAADGTFSEVQSIPVYGAWGIAKVDFDDNQIADLALVSKNTASVYLYSGVQDPAGPPGKGTGTFNYYTYVSVGINPESIISYDINLDGIDDLLVTQYQSAGAVSYLKGYAGGYVYDQLVPAGALPSHVNIADINNDGSGDLIVSSRSTPLARILTSSISSGGDIQFFQGPDMPLVGGSSYLIAPVDITGDSIIDLVVSDYNGQQAIVLVGPSNDCGNTPPIITGGPAPEVSVNTLYEFTPLVEDPDPQDTHLFQGENIPYWASFDTATGTISGIPTGADTGIFESISISVTDLRSPPVYLSEFSIDVTAPGGMPELYGVSPYFIYQGEQYQFTAYAYDPDGDPLEFWVEGMPGWLTFDEETGSISGVPGNSDVGFYEGFRLLVTDGNYIVAWPIYLQVENINDPPEISGTPSGSVLVGDEFAFAPQIADPDLIYGDELDIEVRKLPEWCSFDRSTGRLHGIPLYGDEGNWPNIEIVVTDSEGTAVSSGTFTIEVLPAPNPDPPEDPALSAPPLDLSTVTIFADAVSFLWEGDEPVQIGVAPGVIDPTRVAVIRGRVLDVSGEPLAGVSVRSAVSRQYGATLSRDDGWYDLALNGGGSVTLEYYLAGHIVSQRTIDTDANDYFSIDDVVMVPVSSMGTAIDLSQSVQIAHGTTEMDDNGARRASLVFLAGTQATLKYPDGTTEPISSFTVRPTEITVGELGPLAMPAELPAFTNYNYAIEYFVDEAAERRAVSVEFNQPVIGYVDNFLEWPVGAAIPVGAYDRLRRVWEPKDNGSVIQILSEAGGIAELDVVGNGLPATTAQLSEFGISPAERTQLASLYDPGISLWRVRLMHFTSPYDLNPLVDSPTPPPPTPTVYNSDPKRDCEQTRAGSIVRCESRVLAETIPVTGTGLSLNYESDRVPGRKTEIVFPIINLPANPTILRVMLEASINGTRYVRSWDIDDLPASGGMYYHSIIWEPVDPYGRRINGKVRVLYRIGYETPISSAYPRVLRAFGRPRAKLSIGLLYSFATRIWWHNRKTELHAGSYDMRGNGLGGWSLSNHQVYDPQSRRLLTGDGNVIEHTQRIDRFAGRNISYGSDYDQYNDGQQARDVALANSPYGGLVVGPDGTVYYSDSTCQRIRAINPDGTVRTLIGKCYATPSVEGEPAEGADINGAGSLALAEDGTLYFVEYWSRRIRKIDPDGLVWTVAGGGTNTAATGILAKTAKFDPDEIALSQSGNLYVSDDVDDCVRVITPDGYIWDFAGKCGQAGYEAADGYADDRKLRDPSALAVAPDGSVIIADPGNCRIVRVNAGGWMSRIAGIGPVQGCTPNVVSGAMATEVELDPPSGIYVSDNSDIYFTGWYNVYRIFPDGIIENVAGTGNLRENSLNFETTAPARETDLSGPGALAIGPNGDIFVGDNPFILRISDGLPGFSDDSFSIPRPDGEEIYLFSREGRHQLTLDARLGFTKYAFGYNDDGRLIAVTDRDGLVTGLEWDPDGGLSAVVAPNGQRTSIVLNSDGYIESIENPAGEVEQFTYTPDGLMTSRTDPRQNTSVFTYDYLGRLNRDTDAEGGYTDITGGRAISSGYTTTSLSTRTAEGRHQSTVIYDYYAGRTHRRMVDPAGLVTESNIGDSGISTLFPDRSKYSNTVSLYDPRFGAMAPSWRQETRQPSGLRLVVASRKEADLVDRLNPLSLITETTKTYVNGRLFEAEFNVPARTATSTTPEGRTGAALLDAKGRMAEIRTPLVEPLRLEYNSRGYLTSVAQGSGAEERRTVYGYDSLDRVSSITDPLLRTVNFGYDTANRVTAKTLPDGREILFSYDANGNVTQVTPPGRPAHGFGYDRINQTSVYTPPEIGLAEERTLYEYNLDRQPVLVTRPDGATIGLGYDAGGRLAVQNTPEGDYTYAYTPFRGTLSSVTAPGGETLSFTYDGSLVTSSSWSGTVSGNVSYTYDSDFRVTSEQVNGGSMALFTYDGDSLLTGAGAMTIQRSQENGRITGTALGAVLTSHFYNGFGEPSSYVAWSGFTPVFSQNFTRDKLGRIMTKTETVQGTTTVWGYGYDLAGRLETVTRNGLPWSHYGYDPNGNRTSHTDLSLNVTSGFHDDQDRLLQYGDSVYDYTANGELARKTNVVTNEVTDYRYDVYGSLRSATLADGTEIGYAIDGRNRRVGKLVNGLLEQGFLYSGQLNVVAELDGAGNVVSRFIGKQQMIRNGVTYRIVTDHLGSPRLVIDAATGTIVQQMDYDEFGNVTLDTNPGFQPFGFAGGLYDRDTGLVRFGARDYDPVTGRWTSKDPILFSSGNMLLFNYCNNDPVNRYDLTGLLDELIFLPPEIGSDGTYNQTVIHRRDGQIIDTYQGSTTPGSTSATPSASATIATGTYSGTIGTHPRSGGDPAINIPGNVPTTGPNPNQGGQPFANGINIHCGDHSENKGSRGCPTIKKDRNRGESITYSSDDCGRFMKNLAGATDPNVIIQIQR